MKLPTRISVAGLMAVVLVSSLGLAALRSGSATWAGGLYLLAYGLFVLALTGAACRGPSERAWWLGFALFGLAYLKRTFYSYWNPILPTTALLDFVRPDGIEPYIGRAGMPTDSPYNYFWVVANCLWSLLTATIGGAVAHALFDTPASLPAGRDDGPRRELRPARSSRRKFAAAGLGGLVTSTGLFLVGRRSDPALWAGAVYLLTWGVLGIAALGAACGRGRCRRIWFGAALFGLGFMILNRSPDQFESISYVHQVTDQFLIEIRPWLPPVSSGFPAETAAEAIQNAEISKALDRPIPMRFPDGTPLEDVLRYVRGATRAPDGHEVAVYVDPSGLQAAEVTMQSPIRIDLEGRPLKKTLGLALKQLRLIYLVEGGLLHIDSEDSDLLPVVDYYLLLGHSLLALFAAGLGAGLVPLVADRRAGPPADPLPGGGSAT